MRKLLLPLLLNSLVATTSVAAPSQLSISLSTATVRIDGATPGTSLLLFSVANELFEDSHTCLAANEKLDAARVTNHIGFFLLGFALIKALPAKGAGEPANCVLNQL